MFAIYFPKEKAYGRFGSYSKVTLVDTPEQASLFTRDRDAMIRKNEINTSGYQLMPGRTYPYKGPAVVHEVKFTHKVVKTF